MKVCYQRLKKHQLIDFINDKSDNKNVLVISGPRQVGKTTLIQEVLQTRPCLFLNLEKEPSVTAAIDRCVDFKDFEDYLKDHHQFNPHEKILVIDEAQQSRMLGAFIRFMKEEWQGATVILTGSVVSELYHAEDRRPVGRETFFDLSSFTFKEFLMALNQDSLVDLMTHFKLGDEISESKHQRMLDYFDLYLKVGGLPEVIQTYKANKDYRKLRDDIYQTYEDDFIRYFSLDEVNLFRRCLETVATHVGSASKDSQVVRVDAPGYKKIAGIFARLEKWKLILKCEQLGQEPDHNKFYSKRYLYDVGILNALRFKGFSEISIKDLSVPHLRTPIGGVIENALALSLAFQFDRQVFGLRLGAQAEIDFGIKLNGSVYPIECKASLKFKENYLVSLKKYLSSYQKNKLGFLLYGGLPIAKKADSLFILPFYLSDELKRLIADITL